jgi:hypothetical protein
MTKGYNNKLLMRFSVVFLLGLAMACAVSKNSVSGQLKALMAWANTSPIIEGEKVSATPLTIEAKRGTMLLLDAQREPLLLLLLGVVLLCAAAGLEQNRLSRMKSKFVGRGLAPRSSGLHKRVAPTTNYHRGRNGKY